MPSPENTSFYRSIVFFIRNMDIFQFNFKFRVVVFYSNKFERGNFGCFFDIDYFILIITQIII